MEVKKLNKLLMEKITLYKKKMICLSKENKEFKKNLSSDN